METITIENDLLQAPKVKERLVWPDLVKFFAMILVIVGHVIQNFVPSLMNTPFYNFLWLVQMPLFVLVSGFFTDARKGLNFRGFLKATFKNVLTLLVPTFSFIFVSTLIFRENSGNILETFVQFVKNPQTSLWFFWVLFIILLIFNIGRLFVKGDKFVNVMIPFIVSFVFFVGLIIYLFLTDFKYGSFLETQLIAYYLPIFCIGSLARIISSMKWTKKPAFKIPLFVVSIAFTLFMMFYFDSIHLFPGTNIIYMTLRILGGLTGSYTIIRIFIFLSEKFKEMKVIANLGRYSLETYYLHILFLRYLPIEKISSDLVFTQILFVIQVTSLLLIFTFLVILITRFVPFIHFIIFGKNNSRYKFERNIHNKIENFIK